MWADKSGSSRQTTIRHDETLGSSSRYTPATTEQKQKFRSQPPELTGQTNDHFIRSEEQPELIFSNANVNPSIFSPLTGHQHSQAASFLSRPIEHPGDGAEIAAFLNSGMYNDEIHSDDLYTDSNTYTSYRHQADHDHSVAEKEILEQNLARLLGADDIVAYLSEARYSEDVYGLPPAVQALVKEAQKEVQEVQSDTQKAPRQAVERLQMIREHFMGRAKGNANVAAQQAHTLQEQDWDKFF
ncbi:hypothetical protein J3Q64DRAFT_1759535 [Phycomyces blakesleeanus]|uniref:Uncharacterized protein n=2 Tax=Phycomyces blakesleeanus TaxID=4837 RepID=A0A162TKP5_PHYB8|nr:hypothetical protein PHYBLDRAFT_150980 [Phycomyces blakesleeanus NRRL 1555(-)]OAD67893.1 hypothetical protein PHYBLDRAFT_150980 [Phycomyces blakesleeanus NRRL 1555(-)]|eukprot:XP_018285933.1 hypothetical protein PHYBLDRAFT_150980 [Phycomyces blakesleeanus NRRL 1555(-)]